MTAPIIPDVLHPAADSIVMPRVERVVYVGHRLNVTLACDGAAPATYREVAINVFAANGIDMTADYRMSATGNWAMYSAPRPAVFESAGILQNGVYTIVQGEGAP